MAINVLGMHKLEGAALHMIKINIDLILILQETSL